MTTYNGIIRRCACWLAWTALLIPGSISAAAEPAEATETTVRVMSFNLRFGTADDGDNRWELRRDLVAATIRDAAPDLLGTQETLPLQVEYLQSQLPAYEYLGRSREADALAGGEQCAVFFLRARFQAWAAGHFWLSETPNIPGSQSWDSSLPRMASWVQLQDKKNGRLLTWFNTHFDHRGAQAREASARLLHQRVIDLPADASVIVTGDFNCGSGSAPHQALLSGPSPALVDTYTVRHGTDGGDAGTFHGFRGRAGDRRIDWILASPAWKVLDADIVRHTSQGKYPSDHFPVTATLQWPDH